MPANALFLPSSRLSPLATLPPSPTLPGIGFPTGTGTGPTPTLLSSRAASPTDTDDMASLYRQYDRSCTPSPDPDTSGECSFVAGDDAAGLTPLPGPSTALPRRVAGLDELTELLGEAIHEAHSHTLDHPSQSSLPSSLTRNRASARDEIGQEEADEARSLPSSASDYSDRTRDGTEAAGNLFSDQHPVFYSATPNQDLPMPHSSMSVSPLSRPSELPPPTASPRASQQPFPSAPQTPGSPHDIRTYPQRMSPGLLQVTFTSSPCRPSDARTRKATLTPRSPVVKRDSEDLNFVDQWQWLEAQFPGDPLAAPEPKPGAGAVDTREKLVGKFDAHFTARAKEAVRKQRLLEQRQQMLGAPRIVGGRSTRVAGRWCEGVPCLNVQDVRRLKPWGERCRMYGAVLGQLVGHETGLDVWVWLKTRAAKGDTARAPPKVVLPAHLQPAGHDRLRDASLSSAASFPVRANAHKAIQIGAGGSGELVELVGPDQQQQQEQQSGGEQVRRRQRPSGMVVNALMEVRNLPFPGLYPHSAGPGKTSHPHPHSPLPPPMTPDVGVYGFGQVGGPRTSQQQQQQQQQEQVKGSGGRFFSTIGRRNSTKRNGSLVTSGKPGSIVISGPMIAGPLNGPRGPRPESTGGRRSVVAGGHNGGEQGRGKRAGAGSTPPGTVVSVENAAAVAEGGKTQRKSFAYGSGGGTGGRGAGESEGSGGGRQQNIGRNEHQVGTCLSQSRPSALPSCSPTTATTTTTFNHQILRSSTGISSSTRMTNLSGSGSGSGSGRSGSLSLSSKGKWKEQVEKLMDILPFADKEVLEGVLESVGGDEVAAIGAYLELDRRE